MKLNRNKNSIEIYGTSIRPYVTSSNEMEKAHN